MDDLEINKLAAALAVRLAGAVTVDVARMHRTGRDKPAAYVDLTFSAGGHNVGTVYGFKLMTKNEGGRWLAVPQTQRKDNPEKWEDRFTWGSKAVQAEAERVVKALFDQDAPASTKASGSFASDDGSTPATKPSAGFASDASDDDIPF